MGEARLTGPTTLSAGGTRARDPLHPALHGQPPAVRRSPGLEEAGFLTSETVFELDRAPESVIAIGGGPIAIELSQAFSAARRPDHRPPARTRHPAARTSRRWSRRSSAVCAAEGLELICDAHARPGRWPPRAGSRSSTRPARGGARRSARTRSSSAPGGAPAPRPRPRGGGAWPSAAAGSVKVDARLRTSVPTIYACGDLAGRFLFTHSAGARRQRGPHDVLSRVGEGARFVPWTTFTDPELAHAGLTLAEAQAEHGADACEAWRQDLAHSDRARADGAGPRGRDRDRDREEADRRRAHPAPAAGEMIHELALAIHAGG